MGKTANGAVWLDAEKTTPFEFYQYWRNVEDADVMKCIRMLTFISIEEIEEMEKWDDSRINEKKEILAYSLTALVHGEEEAEKAKQVSKALFSGVGSDENMPFFELDRAEIGEGMNIVDLLAVSGLAPSKGEARRLVQQGGVSVDGEKVTDIALAITEDVFNDGKIVIKKGKKVYLKIVLK